jgi:hypothetical protein
MKVGSPPRCLGSVFDLPPPSPSFCSQTTSHVGCVPSVAGLRDSTLIYFGFTSILTLLCIWVWFRMHRFPFVQFYLRATLSASASAASSPTLVAQEESNASEGLDQEGLELTSTSPAIASDSATPAVASVSSSSPAGIPSPPTPTPAVRHRRRSHESIVIESYSRLNDPSEASVVTLGAAALLTRSDDSTLDAGASYEGSWVQSPALHDLWRAFNQVWGLSFLELGPLVF